MEVRTKDQEMQAAELRLSHMEQDMVEMSTQNETYRSQVMNLTTQVDIAETQMRALRDQESWIGNDVQVSFLFPLKFSFSEEAKKICAIVLMVLTFT